MAEDFYIDLKFWSAKDAAKIPDYRDVTIIAPNSKHIAMRTRSQKRQIEGDRQNRPSKYLRSTRGKKAKEVEVITIDDSDETECLSGIESVNNATSKAVLNVQYSTDYIDVGSTPSPHVKDENDKENKTNVQTKTREVRFQDEPVVKPNSLFRRRKDMDDLIPPDFDFIDPKQFRMNIIDDSVSSCSSEQSDIFEDFSPIKSQQVDTNERLNKQAIIPRIKIGLDFDERKFGPPNKSFIESLPVQQIYSCPRPECGFTTSIDENIQSHRCARSVHHERNKRRTRLERQH